MVQMQVAQQYIDFFGIRIQAGSQSLYPGTAVKDQGGIFMAYLNTGSVPAIN